MFFFLDWWNAFAWGLYSINHGVLIRNGGGELLDYCAGVLLMMNCGLSMYSHLEIFVALWKELFCFGKVVVIW